MANYCKCGTKVGIFSGANVGGTYFCDSCFKKLTLEDRIKLGAYECRECAYFFVDENYDSFCRRMNKRVDRNKKCCASFERI